MSKAPKDNKKSPEEDLLEQQFTFDKFVQDLEDRENRRKEAQEQLQQRDHNDLNRERDARNREHLHNRLRWRR